MSPCLPSQRISKATGKKALLFVLCLMNDFVSESASCRHIDALPVLIENLGRNLEILYKGEFARLLDLYRQHSLVLGRQVIVFRDTVEASPGIIARGRVEAIGPSLELTIQGHPGAVSSGRLVLDR